MARLWLVMALFSVGFAPAPFLPKKPTRFQSEVEVLQGEWVEMDPSNPMTPSSNQVKYVFTGAKVTVLQYDRVVSRWTMTLVPEKSPSTMDLRADVGTGRILYRFRRESIPGTYRIYLDDRVFQRTRR